MAERMPLAYPNFETSQINFSLPLRLAHKRSMSSLSTRSSTTNLLEVPCLMRSRAASAPVSPAYAPGSIPTHPSGSDSTRSPTFPHPHNLSSPRPRTLSQPPTRRAPPRLQLHDQSRLRTNSTSTSTSSLEASLAELEELIEVLSTPLPIDEFFSAKSETEAGAKAEYPDTIRATPNSAIQFAHDEPGPRWI